FALVEVERNTVHRADVPDGPLEHHALGDREVLDQVPHLEDRFSHGSSSPPRSGRRWLDRNRAPGRPAPPGRSAPRRASSAGGTGTPVGPPAGSAAGP